MALPITVTYTFATATSSIPLSQLDSNFTTVVNAINGIGNGTNALSNATINGFTGDTSVINVGSGQLYKDTSGNVGIGTTSPGAKLEIATTNQSMKITGSGAANWTTVANTSRSFNYGVDATGFNIYDNTAASYRMIIDTSGNVGIGTSSPSYSLHVNRTGALAQMAVQTNTTAAYVYALYSSTVNTALISDATTSYLSAETNNALVFRTNATERMRIDTIGNLLVGTTSNNGTVTSFNSSNTGRAGFFMINAASSLAADALGVSKFDNNTTTSQVFVKFLINNNAAASGLITANGANQAAFTSSSDARLKENITPLLFQLEKICALKPSEFDYKDGTGHQVGFIAQEMQEVYPDCVGEDENGMLLVSGWSKTEACLVSAIQELSAKNDALEARLAKLENK